MSHPHHLAPCGTQAARNRHRRRNENCKTCGPIQERLPIAPCGTKQARRRHTKNKEVCLACVPKPRQSRRGPCGTHAAWKRHREDNETPCRPCQEAREAYNARRRNGAKPATDTAQDFIEEVIFLNNAGEGRHRILTATGYEGREQAFRDRLYKYGHHNLANQILNPWDLAA